MTRCLLVPVFVLVGACGRGSPDSASPASNEAAAPVATAASAASAVAAPSAPATAGASRAFAGTYKTSPGAVAVGPAFAKHRYSSPDSAEGVGEGKISLLIDGSGRVSGSLDGAIGAATLDGEATGSAVSASVRRKDPADRGFSGTLTGTLAGDQMTGTLTLASGQAGLVRAGTFSLAPQAAP